MHICYSLKRKSRSLSNAIKEDRRCEMIMVFMRLLDFDFYPNLGRDICDIKEISHS